jgi:hypothetical protein
MVQTYIWRYRTSGDMFKYNIWNKIVARRAPAGAPGQGTKAQIPGGNIDPALALAGRQPPAYSAAQNESTQPRDQDTANPGAAPVGGIPSDVVPTVGAQSQPQDTASVNQPSDQGPGPTNRATGEVGMDFMSQQNVQALMGAAYGHEEANRSTQKGRFSQSLEQLKAALAPDEDDSNDIEGMKGQRRTRILMIEQALNQNDMQFVDLELVALEHEISGKLGTDVAALWKRRTGSDAIAAARSAFAALQ